MSVRFIPVRGTEASISRMPYEDGALYFATDTNKIYLDSGRQRYSMGGSGASLYYTAQAEVPTNEETGIYTLSSEYFVDENAKPKIDDLIINTDGSFYRVRNVDGTSYECIRMAVSGGGGGGSVITNNVRLLFDSAAIGSGKTFVYGKSYFLNFTVETTESEEVQVSYVISQNDVQFATGTNTVPLINGSVYSLDTSTFPKGTGITLQIMAEGVDTGSTFKRTWTNINTVELTVNKSSNFNPGVINATECSLEFLPQSNGLRQTLHVLIDSMELNLNNDSRNKGFLDFLPTGNSVSVILPVQTHGVHNVELYTTVDINGTTLKSNSLFYELAWYNLTESVPIIWLGEYPETVINYNECIIPFKVYNPVTENDHQNTLVYLYHDGAEIPTSPMSVKYNADEYILWDVSNIYDAGSTQAGKSNVFKMVCGGASREITIFITKEGARDLGLFNPNALILNLNSTGRSNSETTTSRSNWSYTTPSAGTISTVFDNFNWYNNGWLNNNDGNGSYLSVANGASIEIPLPDLTFNNVADYTFELRFRVRNIQEYSTLIRTIPYYFVTDNNNSYTDADIARFGYHYKYDKDGNKEMDKIATRKEVSNTAGVALSYLNSAGQGFCVGTQEAYFNTPGSIVNVRYKEDEIINLSFVVSKTDGLLSIYLNGILSGALDLKSISSFSMTTENHLVINSQYCDIDIFKIRIYRANLSMPDVIHNYISDIHDIHLYDQNQLTDSTDGTILQYTKLLEYNEKNPDNLSMPYAVWEIIDNGSVFTDPNGGVHGADDDKLPIEKGNNRYCKVTFVNPVLDKALEDGAITESFYYSHCPSFVGIGVDINVQGTSSQAYPRRNFKTKFKSATNKDKTGNIIEGKEDWGWFYTKGSKAGTVCKKWNMDNNVCATNKFTWKIDYMESSGTYNTGFANLVGNMYDYHPMYRYDDFSNHGEGYRTSIYGFPCLVFHKHSTAADKALTEETEGLAYEYIGRYNFNLDKSSNEYYGFELDGDHPYVPGMAIADVAECWELEDNQGTWTSFKYPSGNERSTGFKTETIDGVLEATKHFEARYNSESDAIEYCRGDATAAEAGIKNVAAVDRYDGSKVDLSGQSGKNEFMYEKYSNLEALMNWLDSTDTSNVPATDTGVPLASPVTYTNTIYYMVESFSEVTGVDDQGNETTQDIIYYVDQEGNKLVKVSDVTQVDANKFYVYMDDGVNIMEQAIAPANYTGTKRAKSDTLITYNTDCQGYRLKKFVNEFRDHLDLEYCLVYFILTELLLCYDSRGKNMMLASWGPNKAPVFEPVNDVTDTTFRRYWVKNQSNEYVRLTPEDTFDENETYYKNTTPYIWFPIFYDIDTQLGLNNIGAVLWDYDTDATEQGTFSTANSVLWQNFFAGFRTEIEDKYRTLRQARLNEKTIEGAYLCDPDVFSSSYAMRGVRPVIALGLDEWYKYIACGIKKEATWYKGTDRRFGFYLKSYEQGNMKTTDASYVYTCQGDRKLSRELFIRNRLNYLDSWWLAGAYSPYQSAYKTEIMVRANANDSATSDSYLDISKIANPVAGYTNTSYPQPYYDAIPQFEITPFLSQYVSIFYDQDPITPTIKYDGLNTVTTYTTPAVETGYRATYPYNEQLTYIPGGDFLSDIGDISLKYPSHLKLTTGKRLVQLLIGSDAPGYVNGIIGKEAGTFDLNDGRETTNKKGLLQKIVLTGLTALNQTQDVSGSEKLREFRSLNTAIPYVTFAEGAPLDTIHLSKTTSQLKLAYAKNLTKILTSKPKAAWVVDENDQEVETNNNTSWVLDENNSLVYADPEDLKGLYIEGITDYDSESETLVNDKFTMLDLRDVALGYDSYRLLQNVVTITERKMATDSGAFMAINLEDVEWSPYKLIESDTTYTNAIQFYQLTDHNTFETYHHTSDVIWEDLKLNDKLFILDESVPAADMNLITDLSLLTIFNEDYNTASGLANNNFRDTTGSEGKTRPNITGVMYINNSTAIQEVDLYNNYQKVYPNLTIYARLVTPAFLIKYINKLDNGREELVEPPKRFATDQNYKPSELQNAITTEVPIRTNYDFLGWSLDNPAEIQNQTIDIAYSNGTYTVPTGSRWNDLQFNLQENITSFTLYAVFTVHKYISTFVNGDGTNLLKYITYGEQVTEPALTEMYIYKDASALALDRKYKFIGWSLEPGGDIINLSNYVSIRDYTFYAEFREVSVYDDPLSEDYFKITTFGYTNDPIPDVYNIPTEANGIQIELKPGIQLKGKITLPVVLNGSPVVHIGAINTVAITHVFFARNEENKVRTFRGETFINDYALCYIEFPSKLRYIEGQVFAGCSALGSVDNVVDFSNSKIYFLPGGFLGGNLVPYEQIDIKLPGTITSMNDNAFSYNSCFLRNLTIGSSSDRITNNIALAENTVSSQNPGQNFQSVTLYVTESVRNYLFTQYGDAETIASKFGVTSDQLHIDYQ